MGKFAYALCRISICSPARILKENLQKSTHVQIATRHVYRSVAMVYSSHATPGFHTFSYSLSEWNHEAVCSKRDQARKSPSKSCQVISQDSHLVWEKWSSSPGPIQGEEEAEAWSLTSQVTVPNTEGSFSNFTWNFFLATGCSSHGSSILQIFLFWQTGISQVFCFLKMPSGSFRYEIFKMSCCSRCFTITATLLRESCPPDWEAASSKRKKDQVWEQRQSFDLANKTGS